MIYGYIRDVGLNDSKIEQKRKLEKHADEIFEEQHAKNKKRTQLDHLFAILESGDYVYTTDLFILADSTKQLVDLVDIIVEKNASIIILNKSLEINRHSTHNFRETLHLLSEFQSDVIKFRTRIGVSAAASKGKPSGRPKRNDDNMKRALEMYMSKKYTLDEIKNETNISRATLYRHLDL
ncbi:recombinase family protein [Salinicoccus siamensis]|uniref:Recombinase family protein n=1 Tax=Salinicoccus siamensis TaxID=381830 RepID=A0ABV5Z303_9STAP